MRNKVRVKITQIFVVGLTLARSKLRLCSWKDAELFSAGRQKDTKWKDY